jgi:hypothetical protein
MTRPDTLRILNVNRLYSISPLAQQACDAVVARATKRSQGIETFGPEFLWIVAMVNFQFLAGIACSAPLSIPLYRLLTKPTPR